MISTFALYAATVLADDLTLKSTGAVDAKLGYYPVQIAMSAVKPTQITKEPTYKATPKYGTIKLGNGPKSVFVVALDEPTDSDYKIYIDKNQDGDLTNDGDGAWNAKREGDRAMYGVMPITLRASYGTDKKETSSSDYTVGLYRFVRAEPNPLFCYRQSSREGSVSIDGKSHKVLLVENDADGVFNKRANNAKDAEKSRPIWLQIDANDDSKPVMVDARAAFRLGDKAYEATISVDGATISVKPTNKKIIELGPKPAPPAKPLLKPGVMAPDFTSEKWGGGVLKLSDYRGKIVILDFWATWCGPCMQSMPHVQKVYDAVKGQDVVVIGMCVFDEKKAYEAWVPKNQDKLQFQFAYDPAGRGEKSLASKLFNVSAIPTTYVIGKDGKVVGSVLGYEPGKTEIEDMLKKLGVTL